MEESKVNNQVHELEVKKLQLHWLLQITKAINYNLPSANLFEIYHTVLHDHLKVESVLLFANDGHWQIPVCYGVDDIIEFESPDEILEDIINFSDETVPRKAWLNQFETIVPVIHKDQVLAYALIGKIDTNIFNSRREIVTYIHTITNLIVVAIENHRLAKESIKQASMQKELELAAQMQSLLFPTSFISHVLLDIAATYIPHQSVGGDYYDFIPLNEHEALVCMADVSGKGMSAAMLMSNFQANLHAIIKHTQFTLEDLVTELNRCVNRSARGEKYITFFIAKLNNLTGIVEYINAGHNPPMLIHADQVVLLDKGTTGLGMFDDLPFLNKGTAGFPQEAILFCYTDGITDMENEAGSTFGMDMLSSLLVQNHKASSMQNLHDLMVQSFNEFRGGVGYPDDVTFLSIRIFS